MILARLIAHAKVSSQPVGYHEYISLTNYSRYLHFPRKDAHIFRTASTSLQIAYLSCSTSENTTQISFAVFVYSVLFNYYVVHAQVVL